MGSWNICVGPAVRRTSSASDQRCVGSAVRRNSGAWDQRYMGPALRRTCGAPDLRDVPGFIIEIQSEMLFLYYVVY